MCNGNVVMTYITVNIIRAYLSVYVYRTREGILEKLYTCSVIQFFMKTELDNKDVHATNSGGHSKPLIYLQYSTNGGVYWTTIKRIWLMSDDSTTVWYMAEELPELARTNATQIRWMQPDRKYNKMSGWVIDQVYRV